MGNRRSRTVHHHHTRVVHDDSAARNHSYRMQQLSNQRSQQQAKEATQRRDQEFRMQQIREQQQAAKQTANRQHQYKMEQLAKQKQLEMQQEVERQREASRRFEERKKAMKLKEKNEAITRVKGGIATYRNKNSQMQNKLTHTLKPQLEEANKNLNISETEMKAFVETATKALNQLDQKIRKYEEKYKAADDKIRNAIKATDVDEGNIPQFLDLVNDGLLFATMKSQQEQDKMIAKLSVFADLIERTCGVKLGIKTYFKDVGLERLTNILADDGFVNMNELKCDDNDEWKEILQVTEDGLKNTEELKKNQKLKVKERNVLKKICTKADKTWVPIQNDKENIIRESLMTAAPKLSKFFGTLHSVIGEIDRLLTIDAKLNTEQQKAIESASSIKIEEIVESKDEKMDEFGASKNVSTIQFKQDDINNTNQQCQTLGKVVVKKLYITQELASDFIVDEQEIDRIDAEILTELTPKQKTLKEKQQQLDAIDVDMQLVEEEIEMIDEELEEINENENEAEDVNSDSDSDEENNENEKQELKQQKKELKTKRKKLRVKQKKLQVVVQNIEKQIDIIESKRGVLLSIEDVLKEAYTVATNIEDSCLQIIKSQCVTRQSILLARELLKYKPAKPQPEAKPLWDTITKGIGDIFENALQLSKISATYFGFFIKFQHSFDHFVTANKMKKTVSLLVASEYLIKDVNDMQIFQKQIDDKVSKLRDNAIKTIRDCVSHTAGAQEFETAITQRQSAEMSLRESHNNYNKYKFKFDNEFQEKFVNQQTWTAKKRIVEYQMQEINKNVSMNQQWIQQLEAQVKSLEREYPINSEAFPKAVAGTFDGIAIDRNTRVIIDFLQHKWKTQPKCNNKIISTFSGNNQSSGNGNVSQQNEKNQGNNQNNCNPQRNNNDQNNGYNNRRPDDDDDKDDEKNNPKINTTEDNNNENEDEIDRFFALLRYIKTIDDNELRQKMTTFSSNVITKVTNGIVESIVELNEAFDRISSVTSHQLPPLPPFPQIPSIGQVRVLDDITSDDNGYSSKSESSNNQSPKVQPKCGKKRIRRKRKKQNKIKYVWYNKYEYEQINVNAISNIEHEQKIKDLIQNEPWYKRKNIKDIDVHGGNSKTNSKMTLSLELSKFQRRCEEYIEECKEVQLIPIDMRNRKNNELNVHYIFNVRIDSDRKIDIGVSFLYNKPLGISITGFHLNSKYMGLPDFDDSQFNIDNFKLHGQNDKYYKERYEKFKPFVQEFSNIDEGEFVFKNVKQQAQKLWQEVEGTVNQ